MAKCRLEDRVFSKSKYARYAVDVTIQQRNRPSGKVVERKLYFYVKHKLYEYKGEFSVILNGLANGCTKHYPGSVSDLYIIGQNRLFYGKVHTDST